MANINDKAFNTPIIIPGNYSSYITNGKYDLLKDNKYSKTLPIDISIYNYKQDPLNYPLNYVVECIKKHENTQDSPNFYTVTSLVQSIDKQNHYQVIIKYSYDNLLTQKDLLPSVETNTKQSYGNFKYTENKVDNRLPTNIYINIPEKNSIYRNF